jgi:hypothetical protein
VRVRLAREEDLHRPAGRVEDAREPLGIAEEQRAALVGREAAREADRQRLGVERLSASARSVVLAPRAQLRGQAPAAEADEPLAPSLVRAPQLLAGNLRAARPHRRVAGLSAQRGPRYRSYSVRMSSEIHDCGCTPLVT